METSVDLAALNADVTEDSSLWYIPLGYIVSNAVLGEL